MIGHVLSKARFWQEHSQVGMSERQRKIVNRLLDTGKEGFQGGLTTRKYVAMAQVSRATAFREIAELVEKGILIKNPARGPQCQLRFEVGLLMAFLVKIKKDPDSSLLSE